MRITNITMVVRDLDEAEQFYGERFGLPTRRDGTADALLVTVGRTQLRLEHRPDADVCDHLAFDIPIQAFSGAKRWLRDRIDLYELDGQDELEGPPQWDARSLYFPGPSGAVLEFIARRRLRDPIDDATFDPGDIRWISEVGIPVPDVVGTAQMLTANGDLAPFTAAPSDAFAAIGDDHGLFILAVLGRPWRPTADRFAIPSTLAITVGAAANASYRLGDTTIDVVAGGT